MNYSVSRGFVFGVGTAETFASQLCRPESIGGKNGGKNGGPGMLLLSEQEATAALLPDVLPANLTLGRGLL